MPGPLDGVRIIDLTSMIAGPFATMLLGDQGADVIKIERPESGDQMRLYGERSGGLTAPFLNNNRNKRSVAVDLKSPQGVEVVKRLTVGADVVVQNFRPGVVEKLGVDEAALRKVRGDLIYVSVSGFGEAGPLAQKPAYDPIIQAVSGLASLQGGSDDARPRMIRALLPDKLAALAVAQGVSSALYARSVTGEGQHVRISMLEVVLSFLWSAEMDGHTFVGQESQGPEGVSPYDMIYETADGYICVATVTDDQFCRFAKAVGRTEWLNDPRFSTSDGRERNRDARLELMQQALKTGSTAEWLDKLEAADIPCGPVLTRREIVGHNHLHENGSLLEYHHQHAGQIRQARHPVRFDRTPADALGHPPLLGEHTFEVLSEAGFGEDELANLKNEGIIA
jgi:crotonobetainyl-CoA:carnitine CoA-transferase CaiB-like acyl-CoA transferase